MKKFLLVALCLTAPPCFSWDGYDYDRGDYIEIERGKGIKTGGRKAGTPNKKQLN